MELKIPEIKLFGKKIAFPENELMEESSDGIGNDNSSGSDSNCCLNPSKVNCSEENEAGDDKDVNKQGVDKIINSKSVKERKYPIIEESQNPKDLSDFDTVSLDEESSGKQNPDSENDQSDTNNSQTKNLKKPDKIIPCPRCKSMETKFCYYNNYNVNQPRHFCKSCQRYWTAGGTMRNVPVGAGRRKNKNSVSNCTSNINISETAIHNGFHHKPNGTLLSFGSEIPVIEKIASNGNDFARNSCVNVSNRASHVKNGHQETVLQNINTFPAPVPVPVPYYPNHVNYPYPNPISIPVPGFCPPSFPMPFYPYCSIPGSWSFPWLPPVYPSAPLPLPPPSSENHCDFPNPKSLECKESNDLLKGSILVPKTLRICDPNEAAMSSIWTTLGIIKNDSTTNCDLFKAFQPKNNAEKKLDPATSSLLQANPAALSRSVNFQETA